MIVEQLAPDAGRRWLWRFAVAAGVTGTIVAILVVIGAGPRPLPIAGIALAATVVISTAADLGPSTARRGWPPVLARTEPPGHDPRVLSLARLVDGSTERDGRSAALRLVLADAVATRVAARHGVTRAGAPDRFEDIVGADLVAWLDAAGPDEPPPPVSRRQLAAIVTRIEAL